MRGEPPLSQSDECVGVALRRCKAVAGNAACIKKILPGAIDSVAVRAVPISAEQHFQL